MVRSEFGLTAGPGGNAILLAPACVPWDRVTPAMEAGIATHVWSIEEIIQLLH